MASARPAQPLGVMFAPSFPLSFGSPRTWPLSSSMEVSRLMPFSDRDFSGPTHFWHAEVFRIREQEARLQSLYTA